MKLISMKEFIKLDKVQSSDFYYSITQGYANFLSQPLTLGMFVPCDLDGNVLEEPDFTEWDFDENGDNKEFDKFELEYQQAKDRVLFEGFELGKFAGSKDNHFEYIDNTKFQCRLYYRDVGDKEWKQTDNKINNIEDLVRLRLTLTQTAKNQIGLTN